MEQNKKQKTQINEMQTRINELEYKVSQNEKKIEVSQYPRVGSLNDFLVIDSDLSHDIILNKKGEIESYLLYCNRCCETPSPGNQSFKKGKLVPKNITSAELRNLTQRWKDHVITGIHIHNQTSQHPLQLHIMDRLCRIAYGIISLGDPDSRYPKELQRAIKNMGPEKSLCHFGNQHHSDKFMAKVEPIMATIVQSHLSKTLKKIKPSTNVCVYVFVCASESNKQSNKHKTVKMFVYVFELPN